MTREISSRSLMLLDAAAVAWVAICVVLALLLSAEVRGLSRNGDAVVYVGRQVESVGVTLEQLASVPVIGAEVGSAARNVRAAGRRAQMSGREARDSTESLSTLFGIAVIVIPVVPLLFFYLPLRVARARDAAALRRLLRDAPDDPHLQRLLAHRALMTLPYHRLARLPGRPWEDLSAGRYEQLAAVEMADEAATDGLPAQPVDAR